MLKTSLMSLAILLALALSMPLGAQTLQAKVSLRADRLLPEDQSILNEIPQKLVDYINNYNWGEDDDEIIIRCDFNFIVEAMVERGQNIYQGQLLVSSQSGENFLDKSIQFQYQIGQLMDHQRASYDPLMTIVDYYAYMVLGGELDTYLIRGGTPYYDRAQNMVAEGRISNFSGGWGNRQEQLETIRNSDHQALRDAKFFYYEGLFFIESKKDRQKGPEYAKKVVELLEQVYRRSPNSTAMKRFLDAHYQEFCTLFSFDPDRKNAQEMGRIDNRHREAYLECNLGLSGAGESGF